MLGLRASGRVSRRLRGRSLATAGGRGETAEGRQTEGERRRRGPGPGYLRVRAQAVCNRHSCAPPPAVRETQLLTSCDSRPAAAGDAQPPTPGASVCEPPSWFLGVREAGTHEEEVCGSATLRAGGKNSGPLSARAGRGWRRRRTVGGAHVPSCCAAGGSSCSPQVASHPGTRRHSAASAAAVAAPRHKHQTSGGGDASPVRWELPEAVVGALARRLSSAPSRSADAPRRRRWPPRSLRVTQFSLGPRQLGVG